MTEVQRQQALISSLAAQHTSHMEALKRQAALTSMQVWGVNVFKCGAWDETVME